MIEQILFYIFAGVLLAAAIGVITARNPVHSALLLVLAFFNSAVLWMLLEAEFLALVLILVYVGAVMVLFLFVVMMLDINVAGMRRGFARYLPLALVVVAAIIVQLALVFTSDQFGAQMLADLERYPADYSNTAELGRVLYTVYVYPFEIAAVILLVAIIAAISLTLRRREGTRHQNVSRQVRARPEERVHLVDLPRGRGEGES